MPVKKSLITSDLPVESVIRREQKGTLVTLFPENVVKAYNLTPTLISQKERDQRFRNEVNAYHFFGRTNCDFVPRLVDFSMEERWFCIERINGKDLFRITQDEDNSVLGVAEIHKELKRINAWLQHHQVFSLGANFKDLVLGDDGKVYLVDFETYNPNLQAGHDLFDTLMVDILQRLFVRKGRTARLTLPFLKLSSAVLFTHPRRLPRHLVNVIVGYWKNWSKIQLERLKLFIKRNINLLARR